MAQRELLVRIVGDDKSLKRAFTSSSRGARNFDRDMGRATRGALAGSGALSGLGKSLAFASGGFITFAAAAGGIRAAFTELNESRKVTAQTNAVLKSTGGIAGVTAKHVEDLGNALLRKTGIDDEAIRSAENLLLTFTNVRNVVGTGNDVFDQATKAILDMSVAMGGDLEGATIRVGKALQDPIRGATALRRVGVQLTAAQEEQIRAFVKTGRVMDAQRVILRELTREFGGSAAAAGRVQPWNLLRETIRNISADLARSLLPQLTAAAKRLQAWFDNAGNVERLKKAFSDISRVIGGMASAVKKIVDRLGGWKDTLTILVGAWVGFKAAGIASAIAVSTANVVAAGVTASAWRAALIATGWGAFAVAAGIAAAAVVRHWAKVKSFFDRTWIAIKFGAYEVVAAILEVFSHVPGQLGRDASASRDAVLAAMQGLREDFVKAGRTAGAAYGEGFSEEVAETLRRQGRKNLGAGPGMTPAGSRGLKLWEGAKPPGAKSPDDGVAAATAAAKARTATIAVATKATKATEAAAQKAAAAADRAREAFARFLDSLQLGLERAQVTAGLDDDLAALRKIEATLRARLKVEKNTVDLQRQLFQVEQQAAAIRRQQRDARQFGALGLSATGAEKIPGLTGLRKQLGSLSGAVEGTFLDTKKTESLMGRIRKVLSGGFGAVSEDVRATIRDMLADIRGQLDGFKGPLTKTTGLDTKSLVAGLGLSPEQVRELRGRVSGFNSAGRGLAVAPVGAGGGGFVGGRPIVVESHTTLQLDGHTVGKVVTRGQQKTRKRNPPQRRGPNAGMAFG